MPSRALTFEGATNFRDLGGYRTRDDRRTRWRRLYRSDALQALTDSDLDRFRTLAVSTVIDLRSADEITYAGRGLLAREALRLVNFTVGVHGIDATRPPSPLDPSYLVGRYLEYLDGGGEAVAAALREVSELGEGAGVINCFMGKDRTGVVCALLLGCLEVERDEIVADYAASNERVAQLVTRLALDERYRDVIARTDPVVLAARPETMEQFLDELDLRYGGAIGWARAAGLSAAVLERLRDGLLE